VQETLRALEAGEAKALVVAKLDRLPRSMLDFAELMATPNPTAPRSGLSFRAIADDLNEAGVPTAQDGKAVVAASVRGLLGRSA
jgi:DNA invertase Pin-like site-specific DNA recombinase